MTQRWISGFLAVFALACGADDGQSMPDAQHDGATLLDARVGDDAAMRDASNHATDAAMDAAHNDAAIDPQDAEVITDAGDAGAMPTVPSYCVGVTSGADPLPNARVAVLVQGGFGFIEGPLWLSQLGVLLFSDMDFATGNTATGPQSQIRRLALPSSFDVFVQSSFSNGLALDRDSSILAATHDVQSLSRIDPVTGTRTPLLLAYQGEHFNSPNDLVVRYDGNIYFTDPDWQIGTRNSETGITGVYRVDRLGVTHLVDGTLDKPNGIALSPDGNTLYVGSAGNEVFAFPIDDDGIPGARRLFATTGASDGFSVDCAGNLYVTSGTVEVFAPNGDRHGEITLGENPSNVAFGGANRRTLYITAGHGLYAIDLNVAGFPY